MQVLKGQHLGALFTFAEVGKHSTLTAAAKSLCLTTGAVSQQLLQLEQQLGFSLLERHSRGIRLTDKGKSLHQSISFHLAEIDAEIASLQQSSHKRQEIRLKLTPSFAFKWLVPKLESFHQSFPDIQVQIFAEGALVNSDTRDFDLAIDYRPHPFRHPHGELLLDEYLLPVMSPRYLERHSWLQNDAGNAKRWQEVTLLHDAMPWEKAEKNLEWRDWAKAMQLPITTDKGHFFNRTDMAMSAAEAGVGIAMARVALIDNELETGRLVSPFSPIKADAGYYLISSTQNESNEQFVDWLKNNID
ncbi:LysR substrate-binding domain-containing protein [Enterovibrio paralichthyis]|uniref:LysR substrate-binding domain-containing protein n=1 Tax=Enterovibrio paralichthyis TaxID=2853805 RepID=UPI001C456217|nr:LysR substrate-binding domain-containing protein [Enterovibrio paralichthyis]MBV7299028.1 LysR family transcriptional regulator [Enterovibrio paralichthyis]